MRIVKIIALPLKLCASTSEDAGDDFSGIKTRGNRSTSSQKKRVVGARAVERFGHYRLLDDDDGRRAEELIFAARGMSGAIGKRGRISRCCRVFPRRPGFPSPDS